MSKTKKEWEGIEPAMVTLSCIREYSNLGNCRGYPETLNAMQKKTRTQIRGIRFWCLRAESNRRHRDFQSLALPTELPRQVADHTGFEPVVSSVTGKHVRPLHQWSTLEALVHYPHQRALMQEENTTKRARLFPLFLAGETTGEHAAFPQYGT